VFFKKWNDNHKPKKESEKREFGKDRWYIQMGQAETGFNTWDRWDRDRGVSFIFLSFLGFEDPTSSLD